MHLSFQGKGLVTTYWLQGEESAVDLAPATSNVSKCEADEQSSEKQFQPDLYSEVTTINEFANNDLSLGLSEVLQLNCLKDKSCNPHMKNVSKARHYHNKVRNRPSLNSKSSNKLLGNDREKTTSAVGFQGSLNSSGSWCDGQQSPLQDQRHPSISRSNVKKITFVTDSESATPLLLNSSGK